MTRASRGAEWLTDNRQRPHRRPHGGTCAMPVFPKLPGGAPTLTRYGGEAGERQVSTTAVTEEQSSQNKQPLLLFPLGDT